MALTFLVVLALAARVHAQLATIGSCPDLKPVENFDIDQFLGKWYEVQRYYSVLELGTICTNVEYKRSEDGKLIAANSITTRYTNTNRVVNGDLTLPDAEGKTGKLNIRYQQLPLPINSVYNVLATDYKTYAILWSCSSPVPYVLNMQNLWLMTRERKPSTETLDTAQAYFTKLGLRPGFIQQVDQTCPETPAPGSAPAPQVPAVNLPLAPVVEPAESESTEKPAPAVRNQQVHVKPADVNTVDVEDSKPVVPKEPLPPADLPEEPTKVEAEPEKEAEQPVPVPDVTPEEPVKSVENEEDVVKAEKVEVVPVAEEVKPVEEPKVQ